jgi:hypothetical protein
MRHLSALLIFLGLSLVFALGCLLVGYFPESWVYLFGGGLLLGSIAAGDYRGKTKRLPVLLCFAVGMVTSPVILAYPVREILGLYIAVIALIVGSTWWLESSHPVTSEPLTSE